jgi:hypothetical protein
MSNALRIKAAKKAVKTRRIHEAELKFIREVIEPDHKRMQALLTVLLKNCNIQPTLRWNPTRPYRKLMNGAEYGKLVGFRNGSLLSVLVEGYKRPQIFRPSSWEVLVP